MPTTPPRRRRAARAETAAALAALVVLLSGGVALAGEVSVEQRVTGPAGSTMSAATTVRLWSVSSAVEPVVSIREYGTVTWRGDVDAAARTFWEAVQRLAPVCPGPRDAKEAAKEGR